MLDFLREFYDRFKDALSQEWPMVKTTPAAYLFALLVGFWLGSIWYKGQFNFYDQQIAAYKERLGEIPKETKYTRLSNNELRRETSRLTARLRVFERRDAADQRERMARQTGQFRGDKSKEDEQRIWQQQREEDAAYAGQRDLKFQQEFVADIIALRNTLLERLPPAEREERLRNPYVDDTLVSGSLAGPDPIGIIASDLEQLAGLLPSQPDNWFPLRWQDGAFTFGLLTVLYFWVLRQWAKYRQTASPSAVMGVAVRVTCFLALLVLFGALLFLFSVDVTSLVCNV